MPTALERLEALEPQIESLRNSVEERSVLQALRTRATQVASKRLALEMQLALFERVERLGGKIRSRPRASAQLRGKPRNLIARLEANPGDVVDTAQWDTSFVTPLEVFTAKVPEAALDSWQSLVDEKATSVGDDVLDQFDRAGFSRQVKEVRAARDRIRELRSRIPSDDSVLNEVIKLSGLAASELAALEAVPLAVRAFISKAATNDALLDDLTSEVMGWLRERDMLKLIRVGLK